MFARAFQAAAIGTGASSLPAIAGLWREGQDGQPAFTMLTTEPGPDVSPYHNRQVVVLRPDAWAAWIYLTRPEAELLQPLPPDPRRWKPCVRAAIECRARAAHTLNAVFHQ